ncbi:MAG: pirin family protein [Pseudomonadota bacterium]
MTATRRVKKVYKAKPTIEGAGVHLKRAFGFGQVPLLDPFLLLDDFHGHQPADYEAGFPWHPHRGIETITYVLKGRVAHGDSLGNAGEIGPGDVQWMTAGNGIIHQEMPHGAADGELRGMQLWANLPKTHKMIDPRYRDVTAATIPEAALPGGARAKIVCGAAGGVQGPVKDIVIDPEYLDITLPAGAELVHPVAAGRNAFAYVLGGRGVFCQERDAFAYEAEGAGWWDTAREPVLGAETLVHFGDGDQVVVAAEAEPLRFLLISGAPLGEPVAWYGPIVMNTQAELRQAFAEYQAGAFLRSQGR